MQYRIHRNDLTDKIRKVLRMKVWNSKVSKWNADTWLPFAINELERLGKEDADLAQAAYIAYAINLARARGILDGGYEMVLRKLTGWQLTVIIGSLAAFGCTTVDDVNFCLKLDRDAIMAMAN